MLLLLRIVVPDSLVHLYCYLLSDPHRSTNLPMISPTQFATVYTSYCSVLVHLTVTCYVLMLLCVLLTLVFGCCKTTVSYHQPAVVSTELLYNCFDIQTCCVGNKIANVRFVIRSLSYKQYQLIIISPCLQTVLFYNIICASHYWHFGTALATP